jgi:hypothetical protein
MPYAELKATPGMGERVGTIPFPEGKLYGSEDAYAYVFPWKAYFAPRTVSTLLQKGYQLRVATEPVTVVIDGKQQKFDYGTILLPVGIQTKEKDQIFADLQELTKRFIVYRPALHRVALIWEVQISLTLSCQKYCF